MHTIYIGNNKSYIDKLNILLNNNMFSTDSPFVARSYIFEHYFHSKQAIFIFIELDEADITTKRIIQLKKNKTSNIFLLLVGENIPPKLIKGYIQCGINEIIDPHISSENINQLLSVLPRLSQKTKTDNQIYMFRLPIWKRIFDIFFATTALIGLLPLFVFTAVAIRIESRGPAIYTSQRVGSNYKIFGFLKFRSMYKDAEKRLREYQELNQYQDQTSDTESEDQAKQEVASTAIFIGDDFHLTEEEYINRRKKLKANNFIKLQNDPRITHVGHFIRKFSIDELPQLINILKGDMSIVGNRPLPLYEAEQLTSDEYIERFMAPAGLTGLWQVEKRGTEGILSPEERKQLDIQYARKFSFWFDLKIIFRTFSAFIQKENV